MAAVGGRRAPRPGAREGRLAGEGAAGAEEVVEDGEGVCVCEGSLRTRLPGSLRPAPSVRRLARAREPLVVLASAAAVGVSFVGLGYVSELLSCRAPVFVLQEPSRQGAGGNAQRARAG